MIIFHKKDKRYYQVFAIYQVCNKFTTSEHYNMMVYIDDERYPLQSRLYTVSSDELDIAINDLSNFYIVDFEEELILDHKVLDIFDHDEIIEGNPDELEKFYKWYISNENKDYTKVIDLNLSLKDIKAKAIPIEKPWVQCPECAEAFEVDEHRNFVECPKCKTVLNNPYFAGYYPCKEAIGVR